MTEASPFVARCAACGRVLSLPLRPLGERDPVLSRDKKPMTPEGTVADTLSLARACR